LISSAETVVIGAGISGLVYAHARELSADVLVLEAADRPGGLIRTREVEGSYVECGPEALQGDSEEAQALLDKLKLTAVPAPDSAKRRYILHRPPRTTEVWAERSGLEGELACVPTSPGAFLSFPLLTWRGKLRIFAEPFRSREGGLQGSIADFARHRIGAEAATWLADPVVTGIYAGDSEQISLRAAFPKVYQMVSEHGSVFKGMLALAKAAPKREGKRRSPLYTLNGGLEKIPRALAHSLGERIKFGVEVKGIQQAAAGWQVETTSGTVGTVQAARLVLAVPAAVAARLTAPVSPALSRLLASIRSESVVSVAHAWRREQVLHSLDGFGYLIPSCLGTRHLGTLFSSSLNPSRTPDGVVLLRTLLGGARHPEMVNAPDDEVLAIVGREAGAILGLSGAPLWTKIERWRDALPRYDLEHPRRLADVDSCLQALPGLSLAGNYMGGISVNSLIESSRLLARTHAGSPAPAVAAVTGG
jgi:oxygen-dependent protoporphyrinogen oxidase